MPVHFPFLASVVDTLRCAVFVSRHCPLVVYYVTHEVLIILTVSRHVDSIMKITLCVLEPRSHKNIYFCSNS